MPKYELPLVALPLLPRPEPVPVSGGLRVHGGKVSACR
jgi:hypothetical protein